MLIELVRRAAVEAPEQPAVISSSRTASYGETLARSEALARGLASLGIERFGCALAEPADIIAVLAG